MKTYKLYQVDAFTKNKFRGNPAGVVLNADRLTNEQMQDIAREMNCSETAFIFTSTSADYDVEIRYFTPTIEVPICGHATIAAHYVRAKENNLPVPTRVISKTGAGILPVDITQEEGDYKVIMTQGKIEFGDLIVGSHREALLTVLGLSNNELDANCPLQVLSTGDVMVGIKSRKKLNSLIPDLSALITLSKATGCDGYFVFTLDSDQPDILTCARMFAPAIGINEDPVTGNANGPLGAYLVHHKLVETNGKLFKFKAKQGEAIHRTGIVEVTVSIEEQIPVKVQVGGNAIIVFEANLQLP